MLRSFAAILAAIAGSAAGAAFAQDYPSKPIVIVVPAAAGGPTDTLTRVLASAMGNAMKQQFVIENAGGAGGIIGINKAAKARPDGYTLLLYHIGMATSPSLYRKLPYDTLNDFDYIGRVADVVEVVQRVIRQLAIERRRGRHADVVEQQRVAVGPGLRRLVDA